MLTFINFLEHLMIERLAIRWIISKERTETAIVTGSKQNKWG
jgi:hypothetical protein